MKSFFEEVEPFLEDERRDFDQRGVEPALVGERMRPRASRFGTEGIAAKQTGGQREDG